MNRIWRLQDSSGREILALNAELISNLLDLVAAAYRGPELERILSSLDFLDPPSDQGGIPRARPTAAEVQEGLELLRDSIAHAIEADAGIGSPSLEREKIGFDDAMLIRFLKSLCFTTRVLPADTVLEALVLSDE